MGGFNFRLGTYNVPSGSSAKSLTTRPKAGRARSASLMGRMGRMGWMGRTGRTDGPEKCRLDFFIICGYVYRLYISGNKKVGLKYEVFRHYWGKNLCKSHLQKLYDYDVDRIHPGDIPHVYAV